MSQKALRLPTPGWLEKSELSTCKETVASESSGKGRANDETDQADRRGVRGWATRQIDCIVDGLAGSDRLQVDSLSWTGPW